MTKLNVADQVHNHPNQMTHYQAINRLAELQSQIVDGPNTFGEIRECMMKLLLERDNLAKAAIRLVEAEHAFCNDNPQIPMDDKITDAVALVEKSIAHLSSSGELDSQAPILERKEQTK